MPIQFRCIECGRLLETADETAGGEAQCPGCGRVQSVPTASAEPRSNAPPPPPAGPPPIPDRANLLAADRVQAPAVGLILVGAMGVAGQLVHLLGGAVHLGIAPLAGSRFLEHALSGGVGVGFSGLFLAFSAIVLYGGWKMMRLESYGWAMAAAIVALVPCVSPCCILGLPLGIWALTVLLDPWIKSAFRS